MKHFFSLDVEEWFHILDVDVPEELRDWESLESRVEKNTQLVLDLLDETKTKCTCFVLGWIAETHPELVREIAERGHEIAAHGHRHVLVYEQTPEQFRRDIVDCLDAIEAAAGTRPVGYRAPGFSIKNDTLWALDVLADCGLQYDASLFTATRGHGGIRMDLRGPARIETLSGRTLMEYPTAPYHIAGHFPVAFAGGGYLRLFPVSWIEYCIRSREEKGLPTVVYCHPRDFDPGQPRIPGLPWKRRFKSYVGLHSMKRKVRRILETFSFGRMIDDLTQRRGTGSET